LIFFSLGLLSALSFPFCLLLCVCDFSPGLLRLFCFSSCRRSDASGSADSSRISRFLKSSRFLAVSFALDRGGCCWLLESGVGVEEIEQYCLLECTGAVIRYGSFLWSCCVDRAR
jgi:hypothetical protein